MTRKPVSAAVLAVVLSTGILVVVLFWPSATSGTTTLKAPTATHTVHLSAPAPRGGTTTFDVEVTNPDGGPSEVDEVVVEPVMTQMGHAFPPVTATPVSPGRYRAENTELPMSGAWRITVALRGAHGVERAEFSLLVK